MIKILVDSTCDLPDEIIKKYDVKVLSLMVSLDGKEYLDKKTIQVDEVYSYMRSGIVPKTSQVNPLEIYQAFEEYCVKNIDFIYLAFSSELSGTYRLANSILEEFKDKYPSVKMSVIDSKSGSMATGLIALEALKSIEKGITYDNILNQIYELVNNVEHVFSISDLNWLIKGGRIGRAQGIIGQMMDIKPILDVKDGKMEVIKKVRGRKKALNVVVNILQDRIKDYPDQLIGISHADDIDAAKELMDLITLRLGKKEFMLNKIGSVLGSHLGIGGVGVFFFNKEY